LSQTFYSSDLLRAGRSGVRIPAEERDFLVSKTVQISSETHPASYSMRIKVLSRRGKWPVCEVDRPPTSSAEVTSQ